MLQARSLTSRPSAKCTVSPPLSPSVQVLELVLTWSPRRSARKGLPHLCRKGRLARPRHVLTQARGRRRRLLYARRQAAQGPRRLGESLEPPLALCFSWARGADSCVCVGGLLYQAIQHRRQARRVKRVVDVLFFILHAQRMPMRSNQQYLSWNSQEKEKKSSYEREKRERPRLCTILVVISASSRGR